MDWRIPSRLPLKEGDRDIDVVEPQPATIYIFSDGRFDDVKGFSLGNLTPFYVPIGSLDAKNLAITAFSTRRSEEHRDEEAGVCAGGEFHAGGSKRRGRNRIGWGTSRCERSRSAGGRDEGHRISAGKCAGRAS